MRAIYGVALEIIALTLLSALSLLIHSGLDLVLYVVVLELSATYFVHCPAHYLVGKTVGINFTSIRVGRTTLAKALPSRFAPFARHLPVLSLSIDKSSLTKIPKSKIRAMYLSGTVASIASAFFIAAAVTLTGAWVAAVLTWAVAIGYLVFDFKFSPKSGDVMRARALR